MRPPNARPAIIKRTQQKSNTQLLVSRKKMNILPSDSSYCQPRHTTVGEIRDQSSRTSGLICLVFFNVTNRVCTPFSLWEIAVLIPRRADIIPRPQFMSLTSSGSCRELLQHKAPSPLPHKVSPCCSAAKAPQSRTTPELQNGRRTHLQFHGIFSEAAKDMKSRHET